MLPSPALFKACCPFFSLEVFLPENNGGFHDDQGRWRVFLIHVD